MRGVVILEVLRRIQEELGGNIKVQEFFDLIVGTRLVARANASLSHIMERDHRGQS